MSKHSRLLRPAQTMTSLMLQLSCVFVVSFTEIPNAAAEERTDSVDELARKVSNPAAFMISVPVHSDFNFSRNGKLSGLSFDIEPVIPFRLNNSWNMISHTDFPFIYNSSQQETGSAFGLGDITQSFSFTPASHGSIIWAVGPQFTFPTATDSSLGSGKLSIGPSALLLHQSSSLTSGLSINHLWSVAGSHSRPDVNQTEIQPFLAWHIGKGRTISANFDAEYDWSAKQWSVPVSASFSKIVILGKHTVSLSVGAKYWIEAPQNSPRWGLKTGVTFLFPQ